MKIFFIILLPILGFVLIIRILEHVSVFYPSKEVVQTPEDLNLQYEDVYLDHSKDDIKIHGWWIPTNPQAKTVLLLHGNAGNIGDRLDKLDMFHTAGVNVLIIDYRGFGNSTGSPSEQGMYADTQLALDYLVQVRGINPSDIIAYGDSLGGVAAVHLAANNKIGGVVIDSSFTHSRDMAKHIYPWVPSVFVKLRLNSLERIKAVQEPKLFYHSRMDKTVPYVLGRKLYQAAGTPKTFVDTKGGHNDAHIHSHELYIRTFQEFLATLGVHK